MFWACDVPLHYILPSVLSVEGTSSSDSQCGLIFRGTWQESRPKRAKQHALPPGGRDCRSANGLPRRILRSFADAGDEDELTRDSYARPYRDASPPPSDRDTDEMLDRVSRSTSESNDIYRRIEEQLRGVARRLESQERTQSENNRVLGKAATEMNIAAREQAQAFDQLGTHVVGLASRLERVERANSESTLKDAVKGLHTGLSRLADQITQNATQSAAQIASLADNLESVAGRLGQTRNDAEGAARGLEVRIAALDDRIHAVERMSRDSAGSLERALEALHARVVQDQGRTRSQDRRRDRAAGGQISPSSKPAAPIPRSSAGWARSSRISATWSKSWKATSPAPRARSRTRCAS